MSDIIHNNKLQILGKLAASLTHEIKNPLSVLKLNLDYLKMSKEKYDDETNECIDAALEAADLINQLIHNTLEFSRKDRDELEEADINKIIQKAVNITKGNANKKNIIIEEKLDASVPPIKVNETNILQVFVNIISNAIDASFENSKIEVKTQNNNGKIVAQVIDFGEGINEEDQEKIFDAFYTNKENGTGLGLNVCKSILEEHNTNFTLSNTDKGTCFNIEFNK